VFLINTFIKKSDLRDKFTVYNLTFTSTYHLPQISGISFPGQNHGDRWGTFMRITVVFQLNTHKSDMSPYATIQKYLSVFVARMFLISSIFCLHDKNTDFPIVDPFQVVHLLLREISPLLSLCTTSFKTECLMLSDR